MIECETIEKLILEKIPDAEVTAVDLTGTKDHFRVEVISKAFEGKLLVEQHRMVQAGVQEAIDDGRIHAFSIVTTIPK